MNTSNAPAGNGDSNDSAPQTEQLIPSDCASQLQRNTADGMAKSELANLFQQDEQNLPANLGERLSAELCHHSPKTPSEALVVAREGLRRTTTLSPEMKEDAMRASIALRTRLQCFLQAKI